VALADALVKCGYVAIKGDTAALTERGVQWARMNGFPPNACRAGAGNLRHALTGASGDFISPAACQAPFFGICSKPDAWNAATSDR
jgi:hypothetical protein